MEDAGSAGVLRSPHLHQGPMTTTTTDLLLEATDVSKTYGAKPAVIDLTLRIERQIPRQSEPDRFGRFAAADAADGLSARPGVLALDAPGGRGHPLGLAPQEQGAESGRVQIDLAAARDPASAQAGVEQLEAGRAGDARDVLGGVGLLGDPAHHAPPLRVVVEEAHQDYVRRNLRR